MISETALVPVSLPLANPWRTAQGVIRERLGWLFLIGKDDGHEGYGEALPLTEAGTEDHNACHQALERLAEAIRNADPSDMLERLVEIAPDCPAARCAAETALVQILAESDDKPVPLWLNKSAAQTVRVNAMAGALEMGIEETLDSLAQDGFSVIKLKVGLNDPATEARDLTALCALIPRTISLRLDANGAWSAEEAAVFIASTSGLPIESLEDPLKDLDVKQLHHLQDHAPFPIALDESFWRLGAGIVFSNPPTRRIVLKPMAAGGPLSTFQLGRKAQKAGLETIVTTTIDGRFGTLAALHAAAALDQEKKWAHGLSTGSWLKENTTQIPTDSAEIEAFQAPIS